MGEMPETSDMLQQLQALQQGHVPLDWLTPESSTTVDLTIWLHHLAQARSCLDNWVSDGAQSPALKSLRLAYMSNASGLLVALRSDIAKRNHWPIIDTIIEIEPLVDGRPRSGAPINNSLILEAVTLIGGRWNSKQGLLELSDEDST